MRMYIVRRLLMMIPILVGISALSFLVIHLAPGDPMTILADPQLSALDLERIRANLGLDAPLHQQFAQWFMEMLRLDFGHSFISGRPVTTIILEKIPVTLLLTGTGMLVAVVIAVVAGTVSAVKQYSKLDYIVSVLAFLGISIPGFWLGIMLILTFSVKLHWLPATGMLDLRAEHFHLWDLLRHMILPVVTLAAPSIAVWTRYIRAGVLEIIHEDYIRTARAKGLSERVVLYKHALRNALLPVITILGIHIPYLFEGAFVTEAIFGWPGMGQVGINAVWQRDYPLVMAINTFGAVLVLLCNFGTDLIYAAIDPRIKYR